MKLVPADKQSFEVKRRQGMVDPGQPLRHAIVIGVFCFKRELLVGMQYRSQTRNLPKGDATIGANPSQGWITVGDEAKRRLIVQYLRRGLVRQSNELVIKIGCSICELRSFHGKFAGHIPWGLPERGEGKLVALKLTGVGSGSISEGTREFRIKKAFLRKIRFKH